MGIPQKRGTFTRNLGTGRRLQGKMGLNSRLRFGENSSCLPWEPIFTLNFLPSAAATVVRMQEGKWGLQNPLQALDLIILRTYMNNISKIATFLYGHQGEAFQAKGEIIKTSSSFKLEALL